MTYPEHDLRENGKDWKACLAVMNEGARHIRLKDKKRKVSSVLFHNYGRSLQSQQFVTAMILIFRSEDQVYTLKFVVAFIGAGP